MGAIHTSTVGAGHVEQPLHQMRWAPNEDPKPPAWRSSKLLTPHPQGKSVKKSKAKWISARYRGSGAFYISVWTCTCGTRVLHVPPTLAAAVLKHGAKQLDLVPCCCLQLLLSHPEQWMWAGWRRAPWGCTNVHHLSVEGRDKYLLSCVNSQIHPWATALSLGLKWHRKVGLKGKVKERRFPTPLALKGHCDFRTKMPICAEKRENKTWVSPSHELSTTDSVQHHPRSRGKLQRTQQTTAMDVQVFKPRKVRMLFPYLCEAAVTPGLAQCL